MESFDEYCKSYIQDHLGEYQDQTHYASDLGFDITMGPNIDGSLTMSRQKAIDYLNAWWWDCARYDDWCKLEFGETRSPFENPEAYMVCMVIEGVINILRQCECLQDFENDQVTLTEEMIEKILEEVENLSVLF